MGKPNLGIIRELAKKQGISLKDISIQLGISPAALQNIMRNNGTSLETLGKLSDILGVSVDVFFSGENKATEILSIIDNALAVDKQRTNDIVNAVIQAAKVFENMKMNDDPKLQKKLLHYHREQFKLAWDNLYVNLLLRLGVDELKQLVSLGYISQDVCDLIDIFKREAAKLEKSSDK
jgi:transcriptional regulator with XRE-family HTH domain